MTPQDAFDHPRPHPRPHPNLHSLSAFTAVSQYPYAISSDSQSQPVSEVVNAAAVINRDPLPPSDPGNPVNTNTDNSAETEPETDEVPLRSRRHNSENPFAIGYGYGQGRHGSGRHRWMIMTAEDGRGSEVEIESPFGDVRSVSPVGILREEDRGVEGAGFMAPDPFDPAGHLRGARAGYGYDDGYDDATPGSDFSGPRPAGPGMRGFDDEGVGLMRVAQMFDGGDFEGGTQRGGGRDMDSRYRMDFSGEGEADEDGLEENEDGDDGQGGEEIVIGGGGTGMLNVGAHNMAMFDNEFPVTTYERNFTVDQFVQQWVCQSHAQIGSDQLFIAPQRSSIILSANRPEKVVRPAGDDRVDFFDLQRIPWWETLRAKRADARTQRDLWYRPYMNLPHTPHETAKRIRPNEFYFREKAMYSKYRASIEHFQLRNLMSVPAYNTVHFASEWRLYSWIPAYDDLTCLMDLSRPTTWENSVFHSPVKISTMKTAHGVSIVGGFAGEYAIRAEGDTTPTTLIPGTTTPASTPSTHGFVTRDPNGITNHIDIIPHRTSRNPIGIFASNDNHLRTLDIETDTFTSDYDLSCAVNCTSTSPDGRLRVVVGDSPDALIIEADTGRPVQPLRGHRDYGFACAWSPDMLHVATGNQDKTTIIWDARMWKPLTMLSSDISGYRSLRYSPVGGGPRTLLMTEPADRIAIVDAQTYTSRQVHDFFGEIAGADFSPDGGEIWVANSDDVYGGFMGFERRAWGKGVEAGEEELGDDGRCVVGGARERRMRFLGSLSWEEYEMLLV
ncbi:WD40 repeat domain-containing protein [Aspergillus ruber CBS 135680]|uniref:Uncharacterized protein n=1 Tax=Aspergillus ruber (strain CBS 135680) TaxID=1388766 RepID=A0A017S4D0_ASPRC|nr:uncharacterized protein EURHEDRAFT_380739 [Aspergillus ruber CBS 135680]EYE91812.1 hypothetical protein EURHEDRAFT_380739 [Aspergillus ruber CBS 135680]